VAQIQPNKLSVTEFERSQQAVHRTPGLDTWLATFASCGHDVLSIPLIYTYSHCPKVWQTSYINLLL